MPEDPLSVLSQADVSGDECTVSLGTTPHGTQAVRFTTTRNYFGTETTFEIFGSTSTLHTSCSQPIFIGHILEFATGTLSLIDFSDTSGRTEADCALGDAEQSAEQSAVFPPVSSAPSARPTAAPSARPTSLPTPCTRGPGSLVGNGLGGGMGSMGQIAGDCLGSSSESVGVSNSDDAGLSSGSRKKSASSISFIAVGAACGLVLLVGFITLQRSRRRRGRVDIVDVAAPMRMGSSNVSTAPVDIRFSGADGLKPVNNPTYLPLALRLQAEVSDLPAYAEAFDGQSPLDADLPYPGNVKYDVPSDMPEPMYLQSSDISKNSEHLYGIAATDKDSTQIGTFLFDNSNTNTQRGEDDDVYGLVPATPGEREHVYDNAVGIRSRDGSNFGITNGEHIYDNAAGIHVYDNAAGVNPGKSNSDRTNAIGSAYATAKSRSNERENNYDIAASTNADGVKIESANACSDAGTYDMAMSQEPYAAECKSTWCNDRPNDSYALAHTVVGRENMYDIAALEYDNATSDDWSEARDNGDARDFGMVSRGSNSEPEYDAATSREDSTTTMVMSDNGGVDGICKIGKDEEGRAEETASDDNVYSVLMAMDGEIHTSGTISTNLDGSKMACASTNISNDDYALDAANLEEVDDRLASIEATYALSHVLTNRHDDGENGVAAAADTCTCTTQADVIENIAAEMW